MSTNIASTVEGTIIGLATALVTTESNSTIVKEAAEFVEDSEEKYNAFIKANPELEPVVTGISTSVEKFADEVGIDTDEIVTFLNELASHAAAAPTTTVVVPTTTTTTTTA